MRFPSSGGRNVRGTTACCTAPHRPQVYVWKEILADLSGILAPLVCSRGLHRRALRNPWIGGVRGVGPGGMLDQ
jgi:hypothetical protein